MDEHTHHHHQAPSGSASSGDDVRQSQVFQGYYPSSSTVGGASMVPGAHDGRPLPRPGHPIAAQSKSDDDDSVDVFGNVPEAKKRKFILVEDPIKQSRVLIPKEQLSLSTFLVPTANAIPSPIGTRQSIL
ncbi:hypothetical protein EYC80_009130 [Monilinia laxa]|uniref:Uncharacterized protein n=1 Tax=Monilinia laxa TaxID=61186 RepID=A0A5N6K2I7_MONLA|nr:hypothetical protein EYC80_009130 [Monilinia laxa]